MPAPQYVPNRTCSVTVPNVDPEALSVTSWFGFNYPSITDAGDFILCWGGVTYNVDSPTDPFYWNVVKIDKATFTVSLQKQVLLDPTDLYYTVAGVVVDGATVYVIAWFWHSNVGHHKVFVLDLATLTVQATSNDITINGFQEVFGPGGTGTERGTTLFKRGDYIVSGASAWDYLFTYKISTNTLAVNGGFALSTLLGYTPINGWACASDGTVYRLSQLGGFGSNFRLDKSTSLSSPSFSTLSTLAYEFNSIVYLDEANGLLYLQAIDGSSNFFWLQISTADGSVVNAFSEALGYQDSFADVDTGWPGYAVAIDNSNVFNLRDAANNLTAEPALTASPPSPDGFWWDLLFTGPSAPMYGNDLSSDLPVGGTATFYEYIPGVAAAVIKLTSTGSVDHIGPANTLASSYGFTAPEILELDPSTGSPWVMDGVNSTLYGAKFE